LKRLQKKTAKIRLE